MRLIDADALIPMMKYATTDSEIGVFPIKIGFDAIVEVINSQPTAQPEIIRCKDCKHFATVNEPYNETFCRLCFMNKSKKGYCDEAERRTDG